MVQVQLGLREHRGREWQECDEHQLEDIKQKELLINPDYVAKHSVVIDPDSADDYEANRIGKIGRPKI